MYTRATYCIPKVMRLFLQKMHNIWIQIFQLIFFKFLSASLKQILLFVIYLIVFEFFRK